IKRAEYFRNVFDPQTKFARPRRIDGSWLDPFDPLKRDAWYAEGNAWQYTWFVPHDVAGLIQLMGQDDFNQRLTQGFELAQPKKFFHPLYVNVGNQPNMQAPWLFNYSGKPWLTQKWSRLMLDEYFGMGPVDGYPGDEDQGQMGGWFVMTAMGLFQTNGGCSVKPVYEVGSPLFDRIVIHLDPKYYSGGTFTIEARNNSSKNVYIQSATLDGKPLNKPRFFATDLQDGGTLVLDMGPTPNKTWGNQPKDAPPSMTNTP
ncbi:MAG: glycoside hydrolase family 92 protein, partial [Phycisphaeraceae bacterium]|nr:glycoside hydrolase family 92 protein [Phycisphaeraceae bacterium]